MAAETPTIVFVHGAWADASGFGGVIRALGDRGFTAIGMANPLRHLTGDAAYLTSLLGTLAGPIVLVATPMAAQSCPAPLLGTSRCRRWCSAMGGGGGLARVHGVAAGGRDPAGRERCGGDQPQSAVSE
jgi:hypothetical protein